MGEKILKPHGPWGEGFDECEAWVRRNRPQIKEPSAWCAEAYNRQKGTRKAQCDDSFDMGTVTSDLLRDMTDCSLMAIEDRLHAAELNDETLTKSIVLTYEMNQRGLIQGYEDQLTEETLFWMREHPEDRRVFLMADMTPVPSRMYVAAPTSEDAWYKLAAEGIDSAYIHRGFNAEAVIMVNDGDVTGYAGRQPIEVPHRRELNINMDKAVLHTGVHEGVYWIFDYDEPELSYMERHAKLKEAVTESEHWKVVDVDPISSKSGFDKTMAELGPSSPFIVAGDLIIKVDEHTPFELMDCACGESCPIKKAMPTPEYPIECAAADFYVCKYVKPMYYKETRR